MTHRALVLPLLLAAGCIGPYPEVGQQLDLGITVEGATTWVATSGDEAKVLLFGAPNGLDPTTCGLVRITGGIAVETHLGSCTGNAELRRFAFAADVRYGLEDERAKSLLSRAGATRQEVSFVDEVAYAAAGGRLQLVGGAGLLAGEYVELTGALGALDPATEAGAACAFQVANLAVLSSQVRVLGFNSGGMTQYLTEAAFGGLLEGQLGVRVTNLLAPLATLSYQGFSDLTGVVLSGDQLTKTNLSGNGFMSGTVGFRLARRGPTGSAALPDAVGELTYGQPDGTGDSVRITNGTATSGAYLVTLTGGGTARIPVDAAWAPALPSCLGTAAP